MTSITPPSTASDASDSILALAPKASEAGPDRGFDKVFDQTAREESREPDSAQDDQRDTQDDTQQQEQTRQGKSSRRASEDLTGLGHVHQLTGKNQSKDAKAGPSAETRSQSAKVPTEPIGGKPAPKLGDNASAPTHAKVPSTAKSDQASSASTEAQTAEQQAAMAVRAKAKARQTARAAANQAARQEIKTEEQAKSAELRIQNTQTKTAAGKVPSATGNTAQTKSTAEEPVNGTQVALNHPKMTMQAKQSSPQEVARPAMVEELRPATGADLAGQTGSQQQDLSRESAKEQPLPVGAVSQATPAATGTGATQAFTPSAGVLTPMLEKIWNAVTTFRAQGGDELVVKLQPNESTEVQLTIRYGKGGVEIQARMQQGDGQQMAAGWNELQQSLADRGVNLSDLNGEKSEEESTRRESDARQFNRENQAEYRDTELEIGEDTQDWLSLGLNPDNENQPAAETVRRDPAVPVHDGWQSWA